MLKIILLNHYCPVNSLSRMRFFTSFSSVQNDWLLTFKIGEIWGLEEAQLPPTPQISKYIVSACHSE